MNKSKFVNGNGVTHEYFDDGDKTWVVMTQDDSELIKRNQYLYNEFNPLDRHVFAQDMRQVAELSRVAVLALMHHEDPRFRYNIYTDRDTKKLLWILDQPEFRQYRTAPGVLV